MLLTVDRVTINDENIHQFFLFVQMVSKPKPVNTPPHLPKKQLDHWPDIPNIQGQ